MTEKWSNSKSKRDIYLSHETWKALRLLAKSRSSELHNTSIDELTDELLLGLLKGEWPQLFEHQRAIAKLESEVIKTLNK